MPKPAERRGCPKGNGNTGAAWLSSARVVRCWVKSRNERNPCRLLPSFSWELRRYCRPKPEEGGDDVKSSWPSCPGLHTCYNGRYKTSRTRKGKLIAKTGLSSDWSLQLDSMKLESLVIANQHVAVNTFPGLVHTARHITKVGCTRSRWANRKGVAAQGITHDWGEVVTR